MSPVRPFPKTMITTKANVQIIGNANEPKLHGVESQAFLYNLAARPHKRRLDLHTGKGAALGEVQGFKELRGRFRRSFLFGKVFDQCSFDGKRRKVARTTRIDKDL